MPVIMTDTDDASFDVVGNTDGITIYYEHETGTDQIDAGGVVTRYLWLKLLQAILILHRRRAAQGQLLGVT